MKKFCKDLFFFLNFFLPRKVELRPPLLSFAKNLKENRCWHVLT